MVNKYDKSIAEIRIKKLLENYVSKEELKMEGTKYENTIQSSIDVINRKINDEIENERRNTDAKLDKIYMFLKIITIIMVFMIVFLIIFVISFFRLESTVYTVLSETSRGLEIITSLMI